MTRNRIIGIGSGILVVAAIAAAAVFWRPDQHTDRRTYNQVRKQLIDHSRRELPARGATPPRPAGLDLRLPASNAAALRKTYPITEANGIEFYACFGEVVQSLIDELRAIDPNLDWYELLTPARCAVLLVEGVEREIVGGSFEAYYLSPSGDGAALAPAALRLLGQERMAILLDRANSQFRSGPPADQGHRRLEIDRLGAGTLAAWKELDAQAKALVLPSEGITVHGAAPLMLKEEREFFRAP